MEKPNFLNRNIEIRDIEKLKGESTYFQNIKELGKTGKLIKKMKEFPTAHEAQEYLANRPQKEDHLQSFLPDTTYIIGSSDIIGSSKSKLAVYAVSNKVKGERLDSIDLSQQNRAFYNQLDDFLFGSLEIYENNGRCPGINLKNLVLNEEGRLFYVDSQPYPEYNIEPFEMAHARKQKLTRIFGEDFQQLLPKTVDWINKNEVANYKKAKSAAKRNRRKK
ncbi:hypothetical protein MYX07_03655 [Patescibacteria group bacterium AH-259-L07]|nr:hypothetical protein [Patescibacteria group bacterium AH-259-L07]